METLTVVAIDRIGLLLEMTEALGRQGINIDSISLEVVGKKAVIRLVVEKVKAHAAKKALADKGFKVVESDTIVVKLVNRPGELSKIAKIMTESNINIESVHIIDKQNKEVLCALRVNDTARASKLLAEYM